MASNYKHHRIDPVSGEEEWFFPMEISSPYDREAARAAGLDIRRTRLGNRVVEAVMVPCKHVEQVNGQDEYCETSAEEQHRLYKEYIREELAEQDRLKRDCRCMIPDGKGGLVRCPCRKPTLCGGSTKTRPVLCEDCRYEAFRCMRSVVPFSALENDGDDGEPVAFEPVSPASSFLADRYLDLAARFIRFVEERDPKLVPLAGQRVLEYSISTAAKRLHCPVSTCISRNEKLKRLVVEFLEDEGGW